MPDGKNGTLSFCVALAGIHPPDTCVDLGKEIEAMGFDRIVAYDDLMCYSSTQVLMLIAANTTKIELGPCLVNGFYRHPAVIAKEAAFLELLAPGRTFLGVGRGAFYDFYDMRRDGEYTTTCVVETIQQIQRLWAYNKDPLVGEIFHATPKAFLRVPFVPPPPPQIKIPMLVGAWSPRLAHIAGELGCSMQAGEVWDAEYLIELKANLLGGAREIGAEADAKFTIGGLTCVVEDESQLPAALQATKGATAVYLPYLQTFIRRCGFDPTTPEFKEMFRLSGEGKYPECAALIPDEVAEKVSIIGTCDMVFERLRDLHQEVGVDGFMFGPPYGVQGDTKKDLRLLMNKVIHKLRAE